MAKRIRGIYERVKDSGEWWIHYHDASGKRHREKVGRRSDAISLYSVRKTDIRRGEKLPELRKKVVLFGEVVDDAVEYAKEHNKSVRDYTGKAGIVKQDLADVRLDEVTHVILTDWLRKKHIKGPTYNRYRAFFSLCFREAIRNGKTKENPAKLMIHRKESSGRKRYLSHAEYKKIIDALEDYHPWQRVAFIVSVYTGMRLSEQFSLQIGQVDFDRREINLTKTKNGDDRHIPMNDLVLKTLREFVPDDVPKTSLVFPRPRGGKGQVQSEWFVSLMQKLGFEGMVWHSLRHTFCSWLAIEGVPIQTIQELAGHKTLSMTARYSHLSPDAKAASVRKLMCFS